MSLFAMIAGAAAVTAGVALTLTGVGASFAPYLISAGAGQILSGIGTMLSGNQKQGFSSAQRNAIAPWEILYGRNCVGGTVIWQGFWGSNNKFMDIVIVLADHK